MPEQEPDIPLAELEGYAEVAGIIARRPLYHFSWVHSFCYHSQQEDELGNHWRDIELVMGESKAPSARIGIRFHRVDHVAFSGFGEIEGLFFRSIKKRNWEKLRYEVGDYEESKISLFCHGIALFDPGREV
ncbi:hypothetical protein [Haloferula sp. BvORR071]|uniref:hypothetical protein n=1 Tax=Haloferula sp. BvORR071 TaxID=1396141 RepID=UPI0005515687|nr:hypothetical protein [Haloferula sp. BvORR071]